MFVYSNTISGRCTETIQRQLVKVIRWRKPGELNLSEQLSGEAVFFFQREKVCFFYKLNPFKKEESVLDDFTGWKDKNV